MDRISPAVAKAMAGQGDLKCPKRRWLEKLRFTGVRFWLKYLLDTDSDPQITQIPQTLYRKCIRDRSKVA
jgi:hypothetical protein